MQTGNILAYIIHTHTHTVSHTHTQTHTHTWMYPCDQHISHFVHHRLNLEQPRGIPVVWRPVEQLHLASTAPRINHHTIVVAANVCIQRGRENISIKTTQDSISNHITRQYLLEGCTPSLVPRPHPGNEA